METMIQFIVVFALLCAVPVLQPAIALALSDVSIMGNRFYTNNQPYYPTTNFLSSSAAYPYTHVYLSNQITDAQRSNMITELKKQGYNSIFIYTLNEGDYSGKTVTPYQTGIIGGEFDNVKLSDWRAKLQALINQGLRPIIWLIADDSPAIRNASLTELKRYSLKMIQTFDDLPVMWVLALEVDEYWPRPNSKGDQLGAYVATITNKPLGIHQLSGKTDFMTASWVDYGMYQYGFGKSWDQIYTDTLNKHAINGKPFVSAEYDKDGGFLANQRGLAAAFAGNAGLGNGAPKGLDSFMASLPSGLIPSRSGNLLYLKNNTLTAVADMTTGNYYLQDQNTPTPTHKPATTPTPPSSSPTPQPSTLIRTLSVNDPASFWRTRVNLTEGDLQYTDRTFAFDNLPTEVQHADWIQTANDSKSVSTAPLATFEVSQPVDVYLMVDSRLSTTPSWLSGWQLSPLSIRNSEPVTFNVYTRQFPPGMVHLGPQSNTQTSMYSVAVLPARISPTPVLSVRGDFDQDRDRDFLDLSALVKVFDQQTCAYNLSGSTTICTISIFDFNALVSSFGL